MFTKLLQLSKAKINFEFLILLLFFTWLIAYIFLGEHILVADGLGWDGAIYGHITQLLPDLLFSHQLDQYSLQRILPLGVVYSFAKLFHTSLEVAKMPMAFSIYNTGLLVLAVFIWHNLAKKLNWNSQVRLISFAGLFLNYAILKMNPYYPILTDTSGFVCGLAMFYFFLTEKNYGVLLTAILGAFVFPTLLYIGLVLFIFPRQKNQTYFHADKIATSLALLLAVTVVSICLFVHLKLHQQALGGYYATPVLYISAISLFAYVILAARPLSSYYSSFFSNLKHIQIQRVFFALIIAVCLKKCIAFFSSGKTGMLSFSLFAENITSQSLAYPLVFLVSHILYYGPIVCLLIYFWNDVVKYLTANGFGLFLVCSLYLLLSIGSESRQLINFLPIAVIVLAEVLNCKSLSWKFTHLFILLSLMVSRAWLPLNHGTWLSLLSNPPEITLAFPMQWYFMSQGPWMSHAMYLVNFILVTLLLYFIYRMTKTGIANLH
ncbi:MAG: hypothetical protein ABI597_03380 [Gammaproteobacteria bacterium]